MVNSAIMSSIGGKPRTDPSQNVFDIFCDTTPVGYSPASGLGRPSAPSVGPGAAGALHLGILVQAFILTIVNTDFRSSPFFLLQVLLFIVTS